MEACESGEIELSLWEAPFEAPSENPGVSDWTPDPEDDPLWSGADTPCEECGQIYRWNFPRATWTCYCDDEEL